MGSAVTKNINADLGCPNLSLTDVDRLGDIPAMRKQHHRLVIEAAEALNVPAGVQRKWRERGRGSYRWRHPVTLWVHKHHGLLLPPDAFEGFPKQLSSAA